MALHPDCAGKMKRLSQWCGDVNRARGDEAFGYVYVGETEFEKYRPKSFGEVISNFSEYRE